MFRFLLIILGTLFDVVQPHLNPQGPIHENYAINCLKEVAVKQFKYKSPRNLQIQNDKVNVQLLTILTTNNLTSPGFEIQQNLIKKLNVLMKFNVEVVEDVPIEFGIEIRTSFYLLVVDSVKNFDNKLELFEKLNSHDPSALVLIYYSKKEETFKKKATIILEKLWGKSITNAAILIPKTLKHLVLYSLEFNFRPSYRCMGSSELIVLDNCINGVFKTTQKYYEGKLRKNFRKCTIDVVANVIEPFVINDNLGFEITLIKQIGESLNVDFNITLTGEDSWGVKDDGLWTNGLGKVYNDSCLGIGNFYAIPDYMQDFDFTVPHFVSELVWIVPIAQYVPKWRVLTVIFSWHVWALCVGLILVCTVLLKAASSSKHEYYFYKRFGNDFLISFQVILMTAVNRQPISDWSRLVFISLSIFSIIIGSVYTSSLINYLTRPQREPQVHSIEGVFKKGYDIGGLPVFLDIFNVTDDEKSMKIYDHFQVNDSLNIWLKSVADDRDTCTICTDFFIKYLIVEESPILTDNRHKPKVYIIEDKIFSYSVSIVASKGFPFLNRINHVIEMLTTFGLVQEMARKYSVQLKKIKAKDEDEDSVQKLSLHHLQGAFTILIFGYLVGVGVLVIELVLSCLRKLKIKIKQKKRKIKIPKP